MRIQALHTTNKLFTPVRNSYCSPCVKNNQDNDVFVKSNNISFGNNLPIAAKLNSFVPEVSQYILRSGDITLAGLEKIVQKTSPNTAVKSLREIPVGANINDRTGAYFHCMYNFDRTLSDVMPGSKAVYINDSACTSPQDRLELLGDVVHEMTHIYQEESSDRIGKFALLKKLLGKDLSFEAKKDTLVSMPQTFAFCDMEFQRPLIYGLQKTDNLPRPVRAVNMGVLDGIYNDSVGCPVDNYIVGIMRMGLENSNRRFPNMDIPTVLNYISATAQCEREAYTTSLNTLKSVLGLKGPTDLDYRIALYERFCSISKAFEANVTKS